MEVRISLTLILLWPQMSVAQQCKWNNNMRGAQLSRREDAHSQEIEKQCFSLVNCHSDYLDYVVSMRQATTVDTVK